MGIYVEGIIWYLLCLDCLGYNILSWMKGTKIHNQVNHWISDYFPLNRFFGLFYLLMVIWLGFALYRMQVVFGFLR